MPQRGAITHSPVPNRVIIVGLVRGQFDKVLDLLKRYSIGLKLVEPETLLHYRHINPNWLIVLTRFTGHKHHLHARRTSKGPVIRVRSGTARAVANAIIETIEDLAR